MSVLTVHAAIWARACRGFTTHSSLPIPLRRSLVVNPKMSAPAPSSSQYSLVCNGEELDCKSNSEEFLKERARGPYTTARTHLLKNIFEFEFHNRRIAESTRLMVEAGTLKRPIEYAKLADAETLRPLHLECIRKAIHRYRSHDSVGEAKLTTLLTVDDEQKHKLYVHCQALGNRPDKPVKIQVMGSPRSNAQAKDSGWVTGRQGLWDSREEGVHEVVLSDSGSIFEGLSSNFFVIVRLPDGTPCVQTAGEGVLLGTVRGLALDMCRSLNIKVQETTPSLDECGKWEECFLSSTSRWVLPVGEIVFADGRRLQLPSTSLTDKVYQAVLAQALEHSSEVNV